MSTNFSDDQEFTVMALVGVSAQPIHLKVSQIAELRRGLNDGQVDNLLVRLRKADPTNGFTFYWLTRNEQFEELLTACRGREDITIIDEAPRNLWRRGNPLLHAQRFE